MKEYNSKKIEKKWQKIWDDTKIFEAKDVSDKPTFISLIEFPFPSGDGMHTGHLRSNTAMDIISHKRRREGFNVMYPIGWDAFGLPTENYAIKTGKHPKVVTKENTDNFRRQLKSAGFSFDWSREINTSDPTYYKWTQWIFLQMHKKGLAYKKKMVINWCPKDKIGLANEEVIDGKCERCGTAVEKREKEQWMLGITKYADRLDKDLDDVDYLEKIKIQQRNWIGKSEGAEFDFELKPKNQPTFYQFIEPGKIKIDKPFVERNAIMALVKHWSEDKFIGLKWKKVDWETLITGGIEGDQTPEEAARAEIREETGYKNIKLVRNLGLADSQFFHVPKDQNRNGHFNMFVFELENSERVELTTEEQLTHEVVWLSEKEFESFRLPSSHRFLWELYKNGDKPAQRLATVFTTRPDTIFGVTYIVLAPEHPLVSYFIHQSSNAAEINEYIISSKNKSEFDRTAENKEKTGVELKGVKAIHPITKEELPVFVADYVLAHYGTGAVMAVPAHDERDFEFAKKYNLPVKEVIEPITGKISDNEEFRKSVVAIVENPQTGKVLCLDWGENLGGTLFIGGGLEGNEDPAEAALREITEETGYKNLKVKAISGKSHHHYFAYSKNVARNIEVVGIYVELENEEKIDQKLENNEKNKFTVGWLTKEDAEKRVKDENHAYYFQKFIRNTSYTGYGLLTESGDFSGLTSDEAKKKITEKFGRVKTTFKLRDWVFSRQRYWGEPIPMVYCEACAVKNPTGENAGWIPVPEKDLPVTLPDVEKYEPTDTGESPLATITDWVNTTCPDCGGPAKRETDTMPNWAGSSWYFLRYMDPHNTSALASQENLEYWMPVDWYNGGMEHTTLHLLYSRFWNKFLFDIGVVPTSEPYQKRTSHGLILAEDGEKMSKSRGNVVNPDSIIENYGADTLRLYQMFMGPFDQAVSWNMSGIIGPRRFLEKIWRLSEKVQKIEVTGDHKALESAVHKTIKKVSADIEAMQFNTAVSAMMILVNDFDKAECIPVSLYEQLLLLIGPFAPHIAEELWADLGHTASIHLEAWPKADESKIQTEAVTVVVQVNGKIRGQFEASFGISDEELKQQALGLDTVVKWLEGKEIKKIIVVKGKLVSIVVG